jgi:DNA-binding MarR family transcriptional regulator
MSAAASTSAEYAHDDSSPVVLLSNALRLLENAHRHLRISAAARHGMSVSELTALMVVADFAGITPKLLAAELSFTTGAVTALIDRLANAGHLTRTPNPLDRRSVLLELTPTASALLADVTSSYMATISDVLRASPGLADADIAEDLARAAAIIAAQTIQ